MRASTPMPAMLKNGRSASRPASIGRGAPSSARSSAACESIEQAERRGEAVPGAGRHETERGRGAEERRARFVDRAVAAPDDHEVGAAVCRGARQLACVSGALGEMNAAGELSPIERLRDQRAASFGDVAVRAGAGDGVDDRDDSHDSLL